MLFTIGLRADVSGETIQIVVLDLDSGEQRVLIEGRTHPRYVSGYLVYAFNDTLRIVRFDADQLEVLSEPIPVLEGLTASPSGGVNVDVSDDGSLVYQRVMALAYRSDGWPRRTTRSPRSAQLFHVPCLRDRISWASAPTCGLMLFLQTASGSL